MQKLIKTDRASTTILIRLMVGAVFFSEGLQKFIFPKQRATDQFEMLGFAEAEIMAHYVGVFEVLAGILILMGLFTRGGALITLIITTTAIIITNMIVVLGESFYPSAISDLGTYGFWGIAPEVHTDWAMWLGSLFLLLKGGGLLTVFQVKENIHSPGVITLNITFTTFALLLMLAMNSLT